jgi:hypothetical protein
MSVKSVIIELELGVFLVSGKREYTELVFLDMSYEKY